jgi:hypothetical protein
MILNLSLNETRVLSEIAKLLYSFLPGSAPPFGRTFTFADAAKAANVPEFWIGGSKEPAIQHLLELTYERRRSSMPALITEIVRGGIKYRQKNGKPLMQQELTSLNSWLHQIGIEVPQLQEKSFLESFPSCTPNENIRHGIDPRLLSKLLLEYRTMQTNPDHQSRGYELQDIIRKLLELYNLKPRPAFRVTGEEIDGSFELDHEVYLLEARWRRDVAAHFDLIAFSSKVSGKAEWSRGLFISMSGFQPEAMASAIKGRRPNFIIMSGFEFEQCLRGDKNLVDLLRDKIRKAAEIGELI